MNSRTQIKLTSSVPIDAAVSPKTAQSPKEEPNTATTIKNSKEIDEMSKNDTDAPKKPDTEEMDESPVKKRQPVPVQPRAVSNTASNGGGANDDHVDLNGSTSPVVPSATMLLHSTSTLNQSAMAIMSATNPAIANCSISTGDSFNVSSSGYNGSSTNGTFNLSMDSVVDKFSDE